MDGYDSDKDLMPDGALSESDDGDAATHSDVIEPAEEYDSDIDVDGDDPEIQQLVKQGFEVCRCDHADGGEPWSTLRTPRA